MIYPVPFTLRLPETCYELDIWRATRTGDLARMVEARITDTPDRSNFVGGG